MKTIGLIGGMSAESTVVYYRHINACVNTRLGGMHSAKLVLYSVDFHEIERAQHEGQWEAAGDLLADAARRVEAAGAELLLLCTNTMHVVLPQIEAAVRIPLLHIADATAVEITRAGLSAVALLGTRFTMERAFYRERLVERHGLRVLVPDAPAREAIHRVIYDELVVGRVRDESRNALRDIMNQLVADGAQAIILGCTELTLLLGADDAAVPLFDTTLIHARAAVDAALA